MSISNTGPTQRLKHLFADVSGVPGFLDHQYYPSLNGLRAISIIMVVVFHLHLSSNWAYQYFFSGKLGVDIFFVISGFLITTLCLKEKVKTSDIDLKSFYIRRFLRIVPVALLYLGFIGVFNKALHFNESYIHLAAAALYLVDFSFFKQYNNGYSGHFWSLAVEEQFYLIFPFLLKKNFKVYLSLLLFIVFLLPVVFLIQANVGFLNKGVFYFLTHFLIKFQGIAIGSLFSVLAFKGFFKPINNTIARTLINTIGFGLIIYLKYDDFFSIQAVSIDLIISTLVALIIITNITPGKDIYFKILNNRLMNTIGILSYSIYIWHMLFINANPYLPKQLHLFPYNVLFIGIAGCLSYYGYERYFLKLRARFSKIKTVNDRVI